MAQVKSTEKNQQPVSHENEGEKLEKQFWADLKSLNLKSLEKTIATEFQSIHPDGARNRNQELELIKKLKLGNYTISGLKTTYQGDTIVVTYEIAAEENIDDKHLSRKATPRLSIWKKNQNQYQLIAHANLNPLVQHK